MNLSMICAGQLIHIDDFVLVGLPRSATVQDVLLICRENFRRTRLAP